MKIKRKLSPAQIEQRRANGIKVSARFKTPEGRAALSEAMLRAHKEGRAHSLKKGNTLYKKRNPENVRRAIEMANNFTRGKHGFGLTKLGIKNNANAIAGLIRSPRGIIEHFSNLSEWCRRNEGLFLSKHPNEHLKTPFYLRIMSGVRGRGFQGWRVIQSKNVWERKSPATS